MGFNCIAVDGQYQGIYIYRFSALHQPSKMAEERLALRVMLRDTIFGLSKEDEAEVRRFVSPDLAARFHALASTQERPTFSAMVMSKVALSKKRAAKHENK